MRFHLPRWWPILGVLVTLAFGFGVASLAPKGPLAPDFTLTDQSGQPWTLSAQRGRALAVFFGYTHCPDVCPTTLTDLARARKRLGSGAARWEVVFVTIDPRRDTPSVLAGFVGLFDRSFVGLSGSEVAIDAVAQAYHIVRKPLPGGYFAHSTTVEFIGLSGRIEATGNWSDGADAFASLMKEIAS
jgi:protein SCO1